MEKAHVMSHILLIGTHGSADPTRPAVAFLFAKGASETGHWSEVILAGKLDSGLTA